MVIRLRKEIVKMKMYQNVEMEIIFLAQDVLTQSGEDEFGMYKSDIFFEEN